VISVQLNEDGSYNVGIHISDVSYFVKPNTALDRDARKRATSVYLVQRSVPMLPPVLGEQFCSLVSGEDRLAFSALFTMGKDARVSKKWFGKTIIRHVCCTYPHFQTLIVCIFVRSSAKLSYQDADNIINGKSLGDVSVIPDHDAAGIEHDVKILHDLAQQLRVRRFQDGALEVPSPKLKFTLDEAGMPIDCSLEQRTDANSLIEEVCYTSKSLKNAQLNRFGIVHAPCEHVRRATNCRPPARTGSPSSTRSSS
jgi:protein SSD1